MTIAGSTHTPSWVGQFVLHRRYHGLVRYLAPPESLTPPKSLYVVWVEGSQGRIMNMGQMNVDRNRRGSFKGVTPLNEFRILITAEDIAAANQPSEQVMLRTEVITVR